MERTEKEQNKFVDKVLKWLIRDTDIELVEERLRYMLQEYYSATVDPYEVKFKYEQGIRLTETVGELILPADIKFDEKDLENVES